MSESQLPEDCRSRIQQGFTASLLLTSLLFSGFWWLQMSLQGVGEALYRAGGPVAQALGDRGLFAKLRGGGDLPPTGWAAGPLPPTGWATGVLPPTTWAAGPPDPI